MAGQWTVGKKVGAGFVVAGVVLLIIALVGYRNAQGLVENDRWVNHTYQVRLELSELMSRMKDAETGQRGFIITGKPEFLEPYNAAIVVVHDLLNDVRALTQDNPEQRRRMDTVAELIKQKLDELEGRVIQRNTEGFEATAANLIEGRGKRVMDDLRRAVGEVVAHEERLLKARRAEADAAAELTKTTVLWGSVFGAAFVALIGWVIVSGLSRQIGDAVRHVQTSSAELQTVANQHATGTREQVTAMNEITTTTSELLATSRQIADSAQRVAQFATQTATAGRAGDSTVEKGHQALSGIQRQVELIVSQMLDLGKKSQQIGGVLEIVSELAEQTNILAINATIEASVAGEAGNRFGVVADEIRKLADRVAGSAKEIRALIEDVRSSINTTIMTTETGSKSAEHGSKQFAEIAAAFKQIAGLVAMTTEAAREIELSTKQQATAVEQVNVAVTGVLQASRETEVSAGQTLQTSSQLSSLSIDLLRLVQGGSATGSKHSS